MSFTYNPANLSNSVYRVRFEIGDTDSDRPLLEDEEIAQIVSEQSTLYKRSAKCCRAICAKYAGDNDYKLGSDSEKISQVYDKYLAMAKRYESISAGVPWAGGINVSEKESLEDNSSLVAPLFKRGVHDNT